MRIDTTLNVHSSIMDQMKSISEISGLTINQIIIRLLHRAIKEHAALYCKSPRRIKYQDRDYEKRWEPKHVRFTEVEYEYINDMKKLYKMSISNVLAFAVRNFLQGEIYQMILDNTSKKNDNYRYSCYAIVMELVENVICWKFFWGIPQNLSTLLPKEPP